MVSWLKNAMFYEIFPSSFMDGNGDGFGDFCGITQKLEYIKQTGFNAVCIAPCFESPFTDGGFDIKDFFSPDRRFGTIDEMDAMLAEAKRLGLRVILDLVPTHTSEDNIMFKKSGEAKENTFYHRFIWTDDIWANYPDYCLVYGGYQRNGAYLANKFRSLPQLNYGFAKITCPTWQRHYKDDECVRTRDWIIGVMRFWLKRGFDGFRICMADELVKNDDNKAATIEVWRYIFAAIRKEFPEAAFISEWGDPEKAISGAGFDADVYLGRKDDGYAYLARRFSQGANVSFFDKEGKGDVTLFLRDYLRKFIVTKKHGAICFITGNHDLVRLSKYYSAEELKIIYATILTLPGVPFVYYGDEIGLQYLELPSIEGGYERSGSRTPMQWNREKNGGFSVADEIYCETDRRFDAPCVEMQIGDEDSLYNAVRGILALRNGNADFASGHFEVEYAESGRFPLVYRRGGFLVSVNPSNLGERVAVSYEGKKVFALGEEGLLEDGTCYAPPRSFTVFRIENVDDYRV